MLCFFNGHCWPVMATHDLPGSDNGGCQFCDWGEETTTAECSWFGRAGLELSGRGDESGRVEGWYFERPRRRMLRQIIGRAVLAPSLNCQVNDRRGPVKRTLSFQLPCHDDIK